MKQILTYFRVVLVGWGLLAITLSGCGVRGPLYFPPAPPTPVKPSLPEPQGTLYPVHTSPDSTNSPSK